MTELLLFVSTFVLVFALGFQSLNVNGHHYGAAFFTSFMIGLSQLALYKFVPGAGLTEIAAYLAGGPLGIIASMWLHRRTIGKRKRQLDDLTIKITADATQAIATLRAMADGFGAIAGATGTAANNLEKSNINCGADRP